ncbi:MAG: hypothetical protein VXZ39_04385, partial [Planctomycetota bacterium]|nr:hypothetical protein [Planctomycetota bacterium]
ILLLGRCLQAGLEQKTQRVGDGARRFVVHGQGRRGSARLTGVTILHYAAPSGEPMPLVALKVVFGG